NPTTKITAVPFGDGDRHPVTSGGLSMLENTLSGLTLAAAVTAVVGIIGVLLRQVGPWRKHAADVEERLRLDLIRRVERLERTLETERAIHKAERSLDRHRLNNVTQCFDALLLLIEMAPERAAEAVQKI